MNKIKSLLNWRTWILFMVFLVAMICILAESESILIFCIVKIAGLLAFFAFGFLLALWEDKLAQLSDLYSEE